MFPSIEKMMCWYHIWSLLLISTGIRGGNCPPNCTNCQYDSGGNLLSTTCRDVIIQSLPNTLKELHVSDASMMTQVQFSRFQTFVLENMVELQRLSVNNYGIRILHDRAFAKTTKLQVLDLSKNSISQISENNFEGLENLVYLSLQQNNLIELGDSVFQKLVNLEELHLALNSLTEIHENDFKGLMKIRKIDLLNNKIAKIHAGAFQGLNELEEINLQGNKLVQLEEGVFKNLPHLRIINLKMNAIATLDQHSFGGNSLTYLDLMQNNITEIPTDLLQSISNQNLEVNLARNHLSNIGQGALYAVVLKTLYLVGNSISQIHPDALCDSFIQTLSLEQNLLTRLPEGLKSSINQSETLSLGNNPWSCDCDIKWVKTLLRDNIQEPVCAEPLSYHGRMLSEILDDLTISCDQNGPLPVPPIKYPEPPRQQLVTPKLEKKSTTCSTISTLPTTEATEEKKDNSNTGLIAGCTAGVIALAIITAIIVVMKMKKQASVSPELSLKCRKPDLNAKPSLKYFPQHNMHAV